MWDEDMSLRELAATSEQMAQNVLLALHDRGDKRSPEEDELLRELSADHGHPGLSCAILSKYDGLRVTQAERELTADEQK